MIDFSQYKFGETVKEEKRTVSKTKSIVFLVIAFIVFALAIGQVAFYLITGFPKENLWFFIVPNAVLAIGCFVMLILSSNTTKYIKTQGEDYSRTKAATSIYLLNALILISLTAIFVGRFISPNFLDVLFR